MSDIEFNINQVINNQIALIEGKKEGEKNMKDKQMIEAIQKTVIEEAKKQGIDTKTINEVLKRGLPDGIFMIMFYPNDEAISAFGDVIGKRVFAATLSAIRKQ